MQTLGLSDSTPRTEGRLKSLFWPTIKNDNDVDYLTRQGFWICFIVAVLSLVLIVMAAALNPMFSGPALLASLVEVCFFFLCGVGIRVLSRVAAIAAFSAYLLSVLAAGQQGIGVLPIIILGLLLANVRATFLAAAWVSSRTEPPPAPLTRTFSERFSDVMPRKFWPIGQYIFYFVTVLEALKLLLVYRAKVSL
jgi:hypothetical protein